jgi:hypothetical protein
VTTNSERGDYEPIDYEQRDDELLDVACRALRGPDGAAALDSLGWWDLLADLAHLDADSRTAVFAVFRAQGRELAGSPALGGLLAQPFVEGTAIAPGSVVAATRRRSTHRGPVWVVVGDVGERRLLFDDPDRGVFVVDADAVERSLVDIPGRIPVHEVSVDLSAYQPLRTEVDVERARRRSAYVGRVAAAAEILGSAERAVDLAVEHACHREQFGQPIGTFQAVRHLLAWAKTDCIALDAVVRKAVLMLDDPPDRYDEIVKALAGRNGRRACERSLQVLGAIGFTAEHAHHHHHSRVLLLDALLGTSADLRHDLGAWLRTSGTDPRYAAAVLTGCR